MAYVDSRGNIVESRTSIVGFFSKLLGLIVFFFQSLFRPFFNVASDELSHRNRARGNGGGGSGGWPGSGGPGGPRYGGGGGGRRPIGRLNQNSGMSCAPVGVRQVNPRQCKAAGFLSCSHMADRFCRWKPLVSPFRSAWCL
ncbi:hypothetical protein L596_004895 [Steinernema carpocapsae]|uniref:Selenoprotein K n=1 Tax=Steinernema carpocapsae TaxID=34508 RepID=A0A4U8UXH0_STECR|nr:hypothetical protein L596_004895 [Steinernema carpocapsae]